MVIKAVVDREQSEPRTSQGDEADAHRAVRDSVEQVMEILERRKER